MEWLDVVFAAIAGVGNAESTETVSRAVGRLRRRRPKDSAA
jgi:hypothetical protein